MNPWLSSAFVSHSRRVALIIAFMLPSWINGVQSQFAPVRPPKQVPDLEAFLDPPLPEIQVNQLFIDVDYQEVDEEQEQVEENPNGNRENVSVND